MTPTTRLFAPVLLALSLSACASHQLVFHPYQGIPADEAAELKQGRFHASQAELFDAAATTLEHEPFLHWSVESLDKVNGFIKADAGLLRELQLRVSKADAAGATVNAISQLAISIPRRVLKTDAKIWVKGSTGFKTAYEPEAADIGAYRVVSADALLDADYLRSFTWHVLHDRVQVPFSLEAKDASDSSALPIDETPAPSAQPQAKQPVRSDAGAPKP